jgi:transglutaminase-like putative cysteine protease
MTRYCVKHVTTYRYVEPVTVSHNVLHLSPLSTPRQQLEQFICSITPTPAVSHQRNDYFGNRVDSFTIQEQHTELVVAVESHLSVEPALVIDDVVSEPWEIVRERLLQVHSHDVLSAIEFRFESQMVPVGIDYAAYALESFTPGRPILEATFDLTKRINRDFIYDAKATAVTTTVPEVFTKRRGVCQDFAHVGLACLRSIGLAARYVSGYLETDPPPGQVKLVGVDASHAWLSIWCPGSGWIGFDPTNACVVGDRHLIVAVGRDFSDVSPTKGVILGGGTHEVQAVVDVTRLDDNSGQNTLKSSGQSQSQS